MGLWLCLADEMMLRLPFAIFAVISRYQEKRNISRGNNHHHFETKCFYIGSADEQGDVRG